MSSSKDHQLWSAAEVGNLEEVANLLAVDPAVNSNEAAANVNWIGPEKGDLNSPSGDGTTPFSKACQEGYVEVVSLLLAKK